MGTSVMPGSYTPSGKGLDTTKLVLRADDTGETKLCVVRERNVWEMMKRTVVSVRESLVLISI